MHKLDADTVRDALRGREADIIVMLLPDGQRQGKEWVALNPSRSDHSLGSFRVDLTGAKAGVWNDFATVEGGDLFDLVRLVTGCDFAGALAYLARAAGIQAPDPRLSIRRPDAGRVAEWKRRAASGEDKGRGCTVAQLAEAKKLPVDLLRGFGLRDLPARAADGEREALPAAVCIPYLDRAGDESTVRIRTDLSAKRGSKWRKGATLTLYGVDRLAGDEGRVLLVEGESDAWTCWHAGIAAVGLPGAGTWRDEWAALLPATATVYVVREPDAAGSALAAKLSASPLRDRLRIVDLPAKDPSDVWCADPDRDRFRATMERAMQSAVVVQPAEAGPTKAPAIALRFHSDRARERMVPSMMIIADLLPAGGIGALIAMPGVGKTLIGLEATRCVAADESFAGRPVSAGSAVYVCTDAPASTERRMLAMPAEVAERIVTITDLPSLPDGLPALRDAVERASAALGPVRIVVLDTWDSLRTHSGGGYAEQDGGAEAILRGLRSMAADLHLAVVIVHHATRQDGGRARGTVVFDARCDWIGVVEACPDGALSLTTTKARDGERGPVGMWTIDTVPVASRPVPVLRWAGTVSKQVDAADAKDRAVLAACCEGDPASIGDLVEATGLPSKSTVSRAVDRLRGRGLMCSDGYRPTPAGLDWLDGIATPPERAPERLVPPSNGERNGTVKTGAFRGTADWNASPIVPPFHTHRGGTERNGGTGRADRMASEPTDDEDVLSAEGA